MPSHEPEVVPSPRSLDVKETQLIDRVEEMKLLREAVFSERLLTGQFVAKVALFFCMEKLESAKRG